MLEVMTKSPSNRDVRVHDDFTRFEDVLGASGDILPYGFQFIYGGEDIAEWGNFAEGTTVFIIDSGHQPETFFK